MSESHAEVPTERGGAASALSGWKRALGSKQGAGDIGGALLRYRVMAYIVGVGLILLVLVGMPLKYGAGVDIVVAIVGPAHGFLYIVYLLAALDLVRRARLSFWTLLAMVAAGLVPFVAFIVERRVTADLSV